jgi:hypothetical protein
MILFKAVQITVIIALTLGAVMGFSGESDPFQTVYQDLLKCPFSSNEHNIVIQVGPTAFLDIPVAFIIYFIAAFLSGLFLFGLGALGMVFIYTWSFTLMVSGIRTYTLTLQESVFLVSYVLLYISTIFAAYGSMCMGIHFLREIRNPFPKSKGMFYEGSDKLFQGVIILAVSMTLGAFAFYWL